MSHQFGLDLCRNFRTSFIWEFWYYLLFQSHGILSLVVIHSSVFLPLKVNIFKKCYLCRNLKSGKGKMFWSKVTYFRKILWNPLKYEGKSQRSVKRAKIVRLRRTRTAKKHRKHWFLVGCRKKKLYQKVKNKHCSGTTYLNTVNFR